MLFRSHGLSTHVLLDFRVTSAEPSSLTEESIDLHNTVCADATQATSNAWTTVPSKVRKRTPKHKKPTTTYKTRSVTKTVDATSSLASPTSSTSTSESGPSRKKPDFR